uniref:Uncharacterized protein n=1 Tax=Parascaris univalens TaxID=6257 RepID=A0A915C3Y7_PARUN
MMRRVCSDGRFYSIRLSYSEFHSFFVWSLYGCILNCRLFLS